MSIRLTNNAIRVNNKASISSKGKEENTPSIWQRDFHLGRTWGTSDKLKFYATLETLTKGGLPLLDAVELARKTCSKQAQTALLKTITQLREGATLRIAMESITQEAYELGSIDLGERTGDLGRAFESLHTFYATSRKNTQQLKKAASYPALILTLSIGTILFILRFVIPMFSGMYKQVGGDLPKVTQILLSLSEFISGNIHWVLLTLIFIPAFLYYLLQTPSIRKFIEKTIIHTPLVGLFIRQNETARFSTSISLSLTSGCILTEGMELAKNTAVLSLSKTEISKQVDLLTSGSSLAAALEGSSFLSETDIILIQAGEASHRLPSTMHFISKNASDELEMRIEQFGALIEPILIVFLGGLVGFILVAMYLPLFSLGSA